MIAHYSAITRRPDMPVVRRHEDGGYYFFIQERSRAGESSDSSMLGKIAEQTKIDELG